MVLNAKLGPVSYNAWTGGQIPTFPTSVNGNTATVTATSSIAEDETTPSAAQFTRWTYQYVQQDGTVLNRETATGSNYARYCEYPGQRLLQKVNFDVNGNPLDEYTSEAAMFHQKFNVAPGKQTGWKRLVGQEVPIEATSDLCSINGTSPFGSNHTGLTLVGNGNSPANATENVRELTHVLNGPQTPKATQPELDLWIPLLFWYCKDARLSIASVSIPYGQRFITVTIAQQNKIVYPAPGNLFLQLKTEVYTNDDGTVAGTGVDGYACYSSMDPVLVGQAVTASSQTLSLELYINNIFVNPEINNVCL